MKFTSRQDSREILFSYGKLERKGLGLVYAGTKRAQIRRSDGEVVFDISMDNNVLRKDSCRKTQSKYTK